MSSEPTTATANRSNLQEYETAADDKPPFILTYVEVKLLGITGVGFFLDGELYSK